MMRPRDRFGGVALVLLLVRVGGAQSSNILPTPAGPSPIGRVTYHWIDSSRAEFLDPSTAARREILVDIWYPATGAPSSAAEPYLPYLSVIRRSLGDSLARRRFAPEYALTEARQLTSHATSDARVSCPATGCPVLIFSHGGGVDRSLYTVQYEDLASHGYVVAAIAHTFDSHLVVFPDGRAVRYAPQPPDNTLNVRQVRNRYGVSLWVVHYWIGRGLVVAHQRKPNAPYAISIDDKSDQFLRTWVANSVHLRPSRRTHAA